MTLEGVGRGARLERAAAEDRRAAVADVAGDLVQHLLVLDRARPRDAHRMRPAHPYDRRTLSADLDDRIVLMKLAAGEFIRLHDGDDLLNPIQRREMAHIDVRLFA